MKKTVRIVGIVLVSMLYFSCGGSDDGGGGTTPKPAGDVLSSITPADGATDIPLKQVITAVFSENLDESTLTATNIGLTRSSDSSDVPGTIAYDATTRTLTFTPTNLLRVDTTYTFTIGAGATTKAEGDSVTSFTTEEAPILYSYAADASTGPHDLWSIDPDGTNQTNLTDFETSGAGSIYFPFAASWSPDLSQIAFTASPNNPPDRSDLYVMDPDGSNLINLTSGAAKYMVYGLRWAPDGSRIYFVFTTDASSGNYNISAINPDGTGMTNITNLSAPDSVHPSAWELSPDGKMLYYVAGGSNASDPKDLFATTVDGSQTTQLTNMPTGNSTSYPRLSDDGSTLYYGAGEEGTKVGLYRLDTETLEIDTVLAPITNYGFIVADVHPSNTQLVVIKIDEGTGLWDLLLVSQDGSETIPLATASGSMEAVIGNYSPDGSQVAYLYGDTADGPLDLFVANADGTGKQNLTNNAVKTLAADPFSVVFLSGFAGLWSPDGTELVFSQTTDLVTTKQCQAMRAQADGSGIVTLVPATSPQQAFITGWW